MAIVQLEEQRVVLHYTDHLGRPRKTRLMYLTNRTLLWISPQSETTVTIGTLETDKDGSSYLKIPVK